MRTTDSLSGLCLQGHVAACGPALGLSRQGHLYWGATLVASEVASAVTRTGGPGGPALLFCSRRSLMYTVFLAQLGAPGGYTHRELTEASGAGLPTEQRKRCVGRGWGEGRAMCVRVCEHVHVRMCARPLPAGSDTKLVNGW